MGGVCAPPPSHRQFLWASLPLGPIARVAVLQFLAFVLVFNKTEPGTFGRVAIVLGFAIGVATLPLGRLLSGLLGNQPRAYCWSGRVWVASVNAVFAMTVGGAYDGTGVAYGYTQYAPAHDQYGMQHQWQQSQQHQWQPSTSTGAWSPAPAAAAPTSAPPFTPYMYLRCMGA